MVIRPPLFGGYMIRILIAFLFVASAFGQRSPDIWTNVSQTIRPVRLPATNLEIANITLSRNASVSSNVNAGILNATNDIQLNGVSIIGSITGEVWTNENGFVHIKVAATNVGVPALIATNTILLGTGTDKSALQTSDGRIFTALSGTYDSPDTSSNPVVKVVRILNLQGTQYSGDGAYKGSAITGLAFGVETNQIQAVGLFGFASNVSTNGTGLQGNDACAVYGFAEIDTNGTGRAIGSFFAGRAISTNASGAHAQQLLTWNNTTNNDGYSQVGPTDFVGQWMWAAGATNSGAGIVMAQVSGQQFDYGLAFNGQVAGGRTGAVIHASIVDDSISERSIYIRGSHSEAAMAVLSGAGPVVLGGGSPTFSTTVFEIVGPTTSTDPLFSISPPANANYRGYIMGNLNGKLQVFASQNAGSFLTGTATGDTGVMPSSGDSFHIGGSVSMMRFSSANELELFDNGATATTTNELFNNLSPATTRGDIAVRGASTNQRLGIGSIGSVMAPWPNTDNTIDLVWRRDPQIWEMISSINGDLSGVTANSGTYTVAPTPSDIVEPGSSRYETGTLTNGCAGVRAGTTTLTFPSATTIGTILRIKTPSSLSTDAEGYQLFAGFQDTAGDAFPTDGAFFNYSHGTNSGAWQGITVNNGSATAASGGGTVPVVADTWYDVIVIGNASTVNFWVSTDAGATVTFIGSSSSNIPSSTARTFGLGPAIRKIGGSVGTANRLAYIGKMVFFP